MTEPTDAEIWQMWMPMTRVGVADPVEFARAVLAKWGTPPAVAGEPVAPDFYTACALYKEGGEAGWIPLPGYSNETEHGVKHLVLESARKEGYKGTADGRLVELGWEIRPVYLTPQPTNSAPAAQGDAAFEAVRHQLCGLQRYSFALDDDGVVRRVEDRTGRWIEFDDAHELFDPVAVDAARSQAKEGGAA